MILVFGLLYNALGAFCAASFYIPFKKVQCWAWETYWNVGNSRKERVASHRADLIGPQNLQHGKECQQRKLRPQ